MKKVRRPIAAKQPVPAPTTYKGKNIRFSEGGFNSIKAFCDERGYRISGFCERVAIEAMERERTINQVN